MALRRTDMADEAAENLPRGSLHGLKSEKSEISGFPVYSVTVEDDEAAEKLGRPKGRYATFELGKSFRYSEDGFEKAVGALAEFVGGFLPGEGSCLVAGLGNRTITADAIGPKTLESVMATRHLGDEMPAIAEGLRRVSSIAPGVLGLTGIETGEIIRGVVEKTAPDFVIAIDALASKSLERLCTVIQLCDSGITPGSGIGNARSTLNRETLGVPVYALGIPTVIYAETIARDVRGESVSVTDGDGDAVDGRYSSYVVTPKDIDIKLRDIAKITGYALDLALHRGLSLADVTLFLS